MCAGYTRDQNIVLPVSKIGKEMDRLDLLFHELFHVLSRFNPELKNDCYNLIGFHKVGVFPFPDKMVKQMITNPDAPLSNYAIRLTIETDHPWCVPLTISKAKKYDVSKQELEFFHYMDLVFLVVAEGDQADLSFYNA